MKRKVPQFIIKYANNKADRIMNSLDVDNMGKRLKEISDAVFEFEYECIDIDDCMERIANA